MLKTLSFDSVLDAVLSLRAIISIITGENFNFRRKPRNSVSSNVCLSLMCPLFSTQMPNSGSKISLKMVFFNVHTVYESLRHHHSITRNFEVYLCKVLKRQRTSIVYEL